MFHIESQNQSRRECGIEIRQNIGIAVPRRSEGMPTRGQGMQKPLKNAPFAEGMQTRGPPRSCAAQVCANPSDSKVVPRDASVECTQAVSGHVVWVSAKQTASLSCTEADPDITFVIESPWSSEAESQESEGANDEDGAQLAGHSEEQDTSSTPDDTTAVHKRKNRPSKEKRRKTWIKKQIGRILGVTDTKSTTGICLPSQKTWGEELQTCNSLTSALKALKSNGTTYTAATALLRISI